MSTRYVWDRFEKTEGYSVDKESNLSVAQIHEYRPQDYPKFGTDYTISSDGKFLLSGAIVVGNNVVNTNPYKYCLPLVGDNLYMAESTGDDAKWWYNFNSGNLYIAIGDSTGGGIFSRLSVGEWGTIKGPSLGNVSSGASGSYPSDGVSGNYWYTYKGSDNIDPSSIQLSKTSELETGDNVTISVAPRSPTYGGTVYYQYQHSIDGGGTWSDIGRKTTATSKTVTIPEGAEQFRVRVQASDGWGFTSTTYVYGPNLPVSQIKAYATVSGKLRAGAKIYATIDGKIRRVQKGYATVGGKIRKLF